MNPKCSGCFYHVDGECRANPPQVVVIPRPRPTVVGSQIQGQIEMVPASSWPPVGKGKNDWCGAFKAKEEQ